LHPLNFLLFISILSIFPCNHPVGHSHGFMHKPM
jgi:hypothetical protein